MDGRRDRDRPRSGPRSGPAIGTGTFCAAIGGPRSGQSRNRDRHILGGRNRDMGRNRDRHILGTLQRLPVLVCRAEIAGPGLPVPVCRVQCLSPSAFLPVCPVPVCLSRFSACPRLPAVFSACPRAFLPVCPVPVCLSRFSASPLQCLPLQCLSPSAPRLPARACPRLPPRLPGFSALPCGDCLSRSACRCLSRSACPGLPVPVCLVPVCLAVCLCRSTVPVWPCPGLPRSARVPVCCWCRVVDSP